MKIINCWDIQGWDGTHTAYLATKAAADEWLVLNKYDSAYEKEFVIHDSMEEFEQYKNVELRKRALNKLTEEEKRALGF